MTPRLLALFLRSRLGGPALAELAAIAALGALLFAGWYDGTTGGFLLATTPLAPAIVLGYVTRSPFGETEGTASRSLSRLRLAQLVLLLGCAGLALLAVGWAAASGEATGVLLRNGAGMAGLAFLGARLFGSGLAWAAPLAYLGLAAAAVVDEPMPGGWWLWVLPDAPMVRALAVALPLFLAGLALVGAFGPRSVTFGEDAD